MSDVKIKTPMPELDPVARAQGFEEVACGYTQEMAIGEADRCLNCRHQPCVAGCPVGIDIPGFIMKIRDGDPSSAYSILKENNALPAVCGRVCPQESQCEAVCIRAIKGESVGIGRLERFAADWHKAHESEPTFDVPSNGRKVAIVGSGPSSLTCADELANHGYDVTVYEALHRTGGVLTYGIPPFRLPKDIVEYEVDALRNKGVKIRTNFVIGRTRTLDGLFEDGFEAIFLGVGAGLPTFLGIPGENLNGVYSANEFLTRINLMKAYKHTSDTPLCDSKAIVVIGGGNVALDAARCSKRVCDGEVSIVYRRSEEEMPGRLEEVHHAKEEGIRMRLLNNPIRFLGDANGRLTGVECVKMELGDPDASGRRRPIPIADSNFVIDTDTAIVSIGTSPNPLLRNSTKGLHVGKWGTIVIDEESGMTSIPGVFAGGDIVTGDSTVILAMGAGKLAAAGIESYLQGKSES